MTLDEAIKAHEEGAKHTWNGKPTVAAEECKQMVEWLKDYKRLLCAIEDIKADIETYENDCMLSCPNNDDCRDCNETTFKSIYNIIDRHISGKEKEKQYWIFTFGCGQKGAGTAVKIAGTYGEAREKMCNKYGNKWAFQYSEEEWNEYQNDPYLCELETITEVIE